MDWVIPEYSRSKVDAAGDFLVSGAASLGELDRALVVINNWRSAHSRPLYTFRIGLQRHAEKADESALVAQRTKRLSSISLKLRLNEGMKLSRMQDIGGCRAVVTTVEDMRRLVKSYKSSDMKHKLIAETDYVRYPKESGYRSHHLIYKYFSDRKATHNGLRIEVQFRSQPQHAWATAVETVGTFVSQALKSSLGEDEWLRFFALMGTAIATRENMPPVPNTPIDPGQLRDEIRQLAIHLDVNNRLTTYGSVLTTVDKAASVGAGADYYLLELDPTAKTVTITPYKRNALMQANEDYLNVEKLIPGSGHDAVLVSVNSMASLRRAYPNYFLDTRRFLEMVDEAIK
jgi:hypothetical protein